MAAQWRLTERAHWQFTESSLGAIGNHWEPSYGNHCTSYWQLRWPLVENRRRTHFEHTPVRSLRLSALWPPWLASRLASPPYGRTLEYVLSIQLSPYWISIDTFRKVALIPLTRLKFRSASATPKIVQFEPFCLTNNAKSPTFAFQNLIMSHNMSP